MKRWATLAAALFALTASAVAQLTPLPTSATTLVDVPGEPFTAVPTADGQWIFASLTDGKPAGIAVLHLVSQQWTLSRVVPNKEGLIGLALTHDGKMLLGTESNGLTAFDVERLESGARRPMIGGFKDEGAESIVVAITADDRFAFVSNERTATVSVFDLAQGRRRGFHPNLLGKIPVGEAPVGLALSPDGSRLYSTSEVAPDSYHWPKEFPSEGDPHGQIDTPAGVLAVIDVAVATKDPVHAVFQRTKAGSSPVRVIVSPDGARVYVTARGSNAVEVFDSAKLESVPDQSLASQVNVGSSPVGIALSVDGHFLFVANSDRFAKAGQPQSVSVIDTTKLDTGVSLTIPAGEFPREIRMSTDGRTLVLTNFSSKTVEVVDISSMNPSRMVTPSQPVPRAAAK
jgi:YVTN family beta-propeller protein